MCWPVLGKLCKCSCSQDAAALSAWSTVALPQERTDIQQQHLAAFAAGSLDVPELQGGSKRAALLRDAQTFLTTTAQVPCIDKVAQT